MLIPSRHNRESVVVGRPDGLHRLLTITRYSGLEAQP
jgi:hypothetical protein